MNEISRYLVGVVTQTLRGGRPTQCSRFNHPIESRWPMLEFYMYTPWKSHNVMTLSYIEDALRWFHTFNEVFLLGRAGKMVKAKANAMTMKLMMQ